MHKENVRVDKLQLVTSVNMGKEALIYVAINFIILFVISVVNLNISILLIGSLGIFLTLACVGNASEKTFKYLFIVSVWMYAFLFLHYFSLVEKFGIPYYAGDDEHFEQWASYLFDNKIFTFGGLEKVVFTNQSNARGYHLFLSWIHLLSFPFGEYHTLMPRILNLYVWQAIAILTDRILKIRFDDSKIEKKMLYALALFPNGLYISSFVYRDTIVLFLIMVVIYEAVILLEKRKSNVYRRDFRKKPVRRVIFICAALFLLFYFRATAVYFCFAIGILAYLDKSRGITKRQQFMAYSFTVLIMLAFLLNSKFIEIFERFSTGYTEYILSYDYGLSDRIFRIPILPYGFLLRIAYGLAVPFPGSLLSLDFGTEMLYSLCQTFVCLGTIFQIFVIPYLIRGILHWNRNALMYLVIFLGVVLSTYTFRHFIMPLPFLAMTVAEEYAITPKVSRRNYFIIVTLCLAVLSLIYLYIKP